MQTEWISRQEAGRRLGVTGVMVGKYVVKGLPSRADKKIEWPAAQEWLKKNNVPTRSGSFKARERTKAGISPSVPVTPEFTRGAAWMAEQLCRSAREVWPKFIAELEMAPIPPAQRLGTRAVMVAATVHLVDGWSSEYVKADELSPIDWKPFGTHAAGLEREYQALRAEWSAK